MYLQLSQCQALYIIVPTFFCERYDLDTGIGKDNFAHMSTDISTIILVIYLNDHLWFVGISMNKKAVLWPNT